MLAKNALKTRFAPSPTGFMHIGNCRTALFNVLLSKKHAGSFLLRIEDTDRLRSESRYIDALIEDLHWLGIDWEEGPGRLSDIRYFQSERRNIYQTYYQQLIAKNLAYPCFCSDEQLKIVRKLQMSSGEPPRYAGTCAHLSQEEVNSKLRQGIKPTLRFRMPENKIISFNDIVRGQQQFASNDLGDFIIQKTDDSAAFMFCNAIDDALMAVTHVLRGEDHLTNTPRQIAILEALDLPVPEYGHISIILGGDGKPLSKRNGSKSVRELREEGLLPEAVLNYLARIGHNYSQSEFMTLSELAKNFSLTNLVKSPAKFDERQLQFWQKEAIMLLDNMALWKWLEPTLYSMVPSTKRLDFIDAIKANILLPGDAFFWAKNIFNMPSIEEESKKVLRETDKELFDICLEATDQCGTDWTMFLNFVKEKSTLKGKQLFQPIRIALTGHTHGPEMQSLLPLLEKKGMLERFTNAKEYCG